MSLINEMLKDLEKRRSRDLETSSSLNENITWETRPNKKSFNWIASISVVVLIGLVFVIGYLLWEKNAKTSLVKVVEQKKILVEKKKKEIKASVKRKTKEKIEKPVVQAIVDEDVLESVDVEDVEELPPIKIKKKARPLNNKQLAEIAYNKGYKFLQQGRMHQGKESLREALSLYLPHIKAREMLAGIYIKSGRFINAAEILKEGVVVVPDYPLFAQLYDSVLLEQNNPQLAIEILTRGSSSATMNTHPDYFALLAATYQRVKNHKKAIDIYLRLVKARPNTGIWWLGLGVSLEKLGKAKEALDAYRRAQNTGSLNLGLAKFTNNRVAALKEIDFPER